METSVPRMMRAAVLAGAGGPEVLRVVERPVPVPAAGQVLIEIAWAGVNPHDCHQRRRGSGPAGETDILGLEVSGRIAGVGEGVDAARIGQRVMALVPGGGNAEFCVGDAALALPVPEGVTLRDAGALPEGLFTAWFNVMELCHLQAGEWLLVHGGTGGVGAAAVQIAAACGARVIATVGSAVKQELVRELGATLALNYRTDKIVDAVRAATEGRGVNAILETTGSTYATANLEMLAKDGRISHISGRGDYAPPLSLIMQKRAVITGSLMRGLEMPRKRAVAAALGARILPLVGTRIRPLIDGEFALDEVARAHARVDGGEATGRVLLRVGATEHAA